MFGPEYRYDYRAKNTLRAAWMRLLAHVLERPCSAYGLYLPGVQHLEQQGYADLGIVPAHRIGCEHDPLLQESVARNADGITVVNGSVQDGVDRAIALGWPCLDFANVDLNGPYNSYVDQILSLFRLFPGQSLGALAVASYSARDDAALETGMLNLSKFFSALDSATYHEGVAKMIARWEALQDFYGSGVSAPLALSREIGLLWWLFYACALIDPSPTGVSGIDEDWRQSLEPHLVSVEEGMHDTGKFGEYRLIHVPGLRDVLEMRRTVLSPRSLAMFVHYSKTGNQPMRTWFLTVARENVPIEQRPTALALLGDFWDLAAKTPLVLVSKQGVLVEIGR